jgi:hypothetical protein
MDSGGVIHSAGRFGALIGTPHTNLEYILSVRYLRFYFNQNFILKQFKISLNVQEN